MDLLTGYAPRYWIRHELEPILNGTDKFWMPTPMPFRGMVSHTRLAAKKEEGVLLEWVDKDGNPGILTNRIQKPTLDWWTKAYKSNTLATVFPSWDRWFRLNGEFIKVIEGITLKWGVINGILIDDPDTFKVLASFLAYSWSGISRVNALRAFANEESKESYSWLFQPGETSHLSPFAAKARERRGAFGYMTMEMGCWKLAKLPQPLMGQWSLTATRGGHTNWLEDQGKSANDLSCVGAGPNEWEVVLPDGLGSKPSKVNARCKLPLANTCKVNGAIQSYLSINGIPVAEGFMEKVALSTYEAFIFGDGGCLCKKGKTWEVIESRTYTIQLPTDALIGRGIGDMVKVGESLLGIKDVLVAEYEGRIQSLVVNDIEGMRVAKVKQEITVKTEAPKFRSDGIKASVHPDLIGVLNNRNFDVLLPVKGSIAYLKLFCDDTKTKVNLTKESPSLPSELRPVYTQWLHDHTQEETFPWEISPKIADIAEKLGLTVIRESRRKCYLERTINVVVGWTVLEVESPVTELRMTHTSLTMATVLEIEGLCGAQGGPVPTPIFGTPDELLTMEHCEEALKRGFRDGLKYLIPLYPNGFLLRNGAQYVIGHGGEVQEAVVAVDAKAILAFTAGTIQATDAVGLTFWNALKAKALFNLTISGFETGVQSIKILENVSANLGQNIAWLQSSINSLAVTGAVLKRLVGSQRIAILGTARTYDFIPTQECWVSLRTLEYLKMHEGDDVFIGRHPTALCYRATIKINDDLPYGVFALSSLAMNVTNKGDVDGDQVWMVPVAKAPYLYSANVKQRELASRLICMMAWNAGLQIPSTEPGRFVRFPMELPSHDSIWEEDMRNYTRHNSDIGNSPFAKALMGSTLASKAEFLDMPLPTYNASDYPRMSIFGTVGIGAGYAILLNSHICSRYAKTDQERLLFEAAFAIGQDIYEDIFNAGYTAERYTILEALNIPANNTNLGERVAILGAALVLNGLRLDFSKFDEKLVLQAILITNNIQHAVRGRKVQLFGYEDMVPVVKALRGLSSGDKSLIVSPEEWDIVVTLTEEGNPYHEIVHSIADVYGVMAMVHTLRQEDSDIEEFEV
jgi:hypothetical protein